MGYKFTREELNILKLHPKSKRERIRHMAPEECEEAIQNLAFLDDDRTWCVDL